MQSLKISMWTKIIWLFLRLMHQFDEKEEKEETKKQTNTRGKRKRKENKGRTRRMEITWSSGTAPHLSAERRWTTRVSSV